MTIYDRPKPDTFSPAQRIINYNRKNCCSYCGNGIDIEDKFCISCGAPNEKYNRNEIIKIRGEIGNPILYNYIYGYDINKIKGEN